jgi:hypothetical protein
LCLGVCGRWLVVAARGIEAHVSWRGVFAVSQYVCGPVCLCVWERACDSNFGVILEPILRSFLSKPGRLPGAKFLRMAALFWDRKFESQILSPY